MYEAENIFLMKKGLIIVTSMWFISSLWKSMLHFLLALILNSELILVNTHFLLSQTHYGQVNLYTET